MGVTPDAEARASDMGARAGAAFVESGVPSPNPFPADQWPALAQAWRRAYLAAVAAHRAT